MKPIIVTVKMDIQTDASRAFDIIVPIDLTQIFKGYAFLPAVSAVKDATGAWDGVGQTRTVFLSDDSTAREKLTDYVQGGTFKYIISGFTGSLKYLAGSAEGQWWFEPRPDETCHIRWQYAFNPVSPLIWPILWCVARLFWSRYMKRALSECRAICEG